MLTLECRSAGVDSALSPTLGYRVSLFGLRLDLPVNMPTTTPSYCSPLLLLPGTFQYSLTNAQASQWVYLTYPIGMSSLYHSRFCCLPFWVQVSWAVPLFTMFLLLRSWTGGWKMTHRFLGSQMVRGTVIVHPVNMEIIVPINSQYILPPLHALENWSSWMSVKAISALNITIPTVT